MVLVLILQLTALVQHLKARACQCQALGQQVKVLGPEWCFQVRVLGGLCQAQVLG